MNKNPLGQNVDYGQKYSPDILFPIARSENRSRSGIDENTLPFSGYDLWNAYEFSWLNNKGKPQCAVLQIEVPAHSKNMVESKSLKLYLNSFNFKSFKSDQALQECLSRDISSCVGENISLELYPLDNLHNPGIESLDAHCLDEIDCEISDFELNASYLKLSEQCKHRVEEKLCSHLFRSLCPVTNQPDWASVFIHYQGHAFDQQGLLKYLLSFRNHGGFHEDCVEIIFCDIEKKLKPEKLTIAAYFTRRGGIDINPFRSNFEQRIPLVRLLRQ